MGPGYDLRAPWYHRRGLVKGESGNLGRAVKLFSARDLY